MPLKNLEESQLTTNIANFGLVEGLADARALQLGDAHLKIAVGKGDESSGHIRK